MHVSDALNEVPSKCPFNIPSYVSHTVHSILNVGLGEYKITTLNTDLREKSAPVSANDPLGFAALALTV